MQSGMAGALVALTLLMMGALPASGCTLGPGTQANGTSWGIPPVPRAIHNDGISSVQIEANATSVQVGEDLSFTAVPSCGNGACPAGIGWSWSLSRQLGELSYEQSNTMVSSTPSGGEAPAGIAYDPDNGDLYVTNDNALGKYAESNVSVISGVTDSLVGLITVGASPAGIAFDPANGFLYVANCGSNNMSVINGATNRLVYTIAVTLSACTIGAKWYMNFGPVVYDAAGNSILVSNYGLGTLSVVNTTLEQVVESIYVGGQPWALAYDPVNQMIYASETTEPFVAVIAGLDYDVLTVIEVGTFPSGLAFDDANEELYVADAGNYVRNPLGEGNITVIDTVNNTIATTINVHGYPWNLVYDPGDQCIYETDSNTSVIKVISGSTNTVIGSFPIGLAVNGTSHDFEMAYDERTGSLFVTGLQFNVVSEVAGASDSVQFTAFGTPGTTTLFLNASWNGTNVMSSPLPVTVLPSPVPVIDGFSASPTLLRVNQTAYLNLTAVGGTGTLQAAYSGLPPGCTSADAFSIVCSPSSSGRFVVRAYANDSAGHSASATLILLVVGGPPTTVPPTPPPANTTGPQAGWFGQVGIWLGASIIAAWAVALAVMLVRRNRSQQGDPPK